MSGPPPGTRISIRGMPNDMRKDELSRYFGPDAADVHDIWIARNPGGFGFCRYVGDPVAFCRRHDGAGFAGRRISVEIARNQAGGKREFDGPRDGPGGRGGFRENDRYDDRRGPRRDSPGRGPRRDSPVRGPRRDSPGRGGPRDDGRRGGRGGRLSPRGGGHPASMFPPGVEAAKSRSRSASSSASSSGSSSSGSSSSSRSASSDGRGSQ